MHTKIKGFTLAEMLVVMLITSLVLGISFWALNFTVKNIHLAKQTLKVHEDIDRLSLLLWKDMHTNTNTEYIPDIKTFSFDNALNSVKYTFSEDFIVRNQDTLFIDQSSFLFYLKGEIITSGEFDAIRFKTYTFNIPQYIFVNHSRDFEDQINGI